MNYSLTRKIKLEHLIGNCLNSIRDEIFLLHLFHLKNSSWICLGEGFAFVDCVFLGGLGSSNYLGDSSLLLFFTVSRSRCVSYFHHFMILEFHTCRIMSFDETHLPFLPPRPLPYPPPLLLHPNSVSSFSFLKPTQSIWCCHYVHECKASSWSPVASQRLHLRKKKNLPSLSQQLSIANT